MMLSLFVWDCYFCPGCGDAPPEWGGRTWWGDDAGEVRATFPLCPECVAIFRRGGKARDELVERCAAACNTRLRWMVKHGHR